MPAPEHSEIEQICTELLALSRRIEDRRAPRTEIVRDRLAYLLDGVLQLLSAGSKTEMLAVALGERNEQGIIHLSTSERITAAMTDTAEATLLEPLKAWCRDTIITDAISVRLGGLGIFNPEAVCEVIGPGLAEVFKEYSAEIAALEQLPQWVNEYEDNGPPHGLPKFYRTQEPLEYRWMPPADMDDTEATQWVLSEPSLELISVGTPKLRLQGGIARIASWFDEEPFINEEVGVAYGGTNGLRVGALIVLRLARCARHISEKGLSNSPGFFHPATYSPYGQEMIDILSKTMSKSAMKLAPTIERRSVTGIPTIPFHPLPSREEASTNTPISDPAQTQTNVLPAQLDIPSGTSKGDTQDYMDSAPASPDVVVQESPKAAAKRIEHRNVRPNTETGVGFIEPKPMAQSDEEPTRIPMSQKPKSSTNRPVFSSSSEAEEAASGRKRSRREASPEIKVESVVEMRSKPHSTSSRSVVKRKGKPTSRSTPLDSESVFKRQRINVDAMMDDDPEEEPDDVGANDMESESPVTRSETKGKAKAGSKKSAHKSPFETPSAEDPVLSKIERTSSKRAPAAGSSRRAASVAGSVSGNTRSRKPNN